MEKTYTTTLTKTYTRTRTSVIDDHFELFLRCAEIDDDRVERILESVHNRELEAFGIYIVVDGYRYAEIEFSIDWYRHDGIVQAKGDFLDTYLPGWKNGQAPEAYIAAGNLVKAAQEMSVNIQSWICVTDEVRSDPEKHRSICKKLGYCYNRSPPSWKNPPKENRRIIQGLEEASVTARESCD